MTQTGLREHRSQGTERMCICYVHTGCFGAGSAPRTQITLECRSLDRTQRKITGGTRYLPPFLLAGVCEGGGGGGRLSLKRVKATGRSLLRRARIATSLGTRYRRCKAGPRSTCARHTVRPEVWTYGGGRTRTAMKNCEVPDASEHLSRVENMEGRALGGFQHAAVCNPRRFVRMLNVTSTGMLGGSGGLPPLFLLVGGLPSIALAFATLGENLFCVHGEPSTGKRETENSG